MEETALSVSSGGNVRLCSLLGNPYGGFSNVKLLPCASAISLLIVKDTKSTDHRDTMSTLITTLVTITKNWSQPKCPSTKEWTEKISHKHIMHFFYSPIKKNEIMTYTENGHN